MIAGVKADTDGTLNGLLDLMEKSGVDIGLPEPVHCPPYKMRKVLDRLKPDKMVLAHLGGWKQWEEVYEYLAGENVYLDTSFTVGVSVNHKKDMTILSVDNQSVNPQILLGAMPQWE